MPARCRACRERRARAAGVPPFRRPPLPPRASTAHLTCAMPPERARDAGDELRC